MTPEHSQRLAMASQDDDPEGQHSGVHGKMHYAARGCNVRVSAVLQCDEVMVSEGSGVFLEPMVEMSSLAGVSLDTVKTFWG